MEWKEKQEQGLERQGYEESAERYSGLSARLDTPDKRTKTKAEMSRFDSFRQFDLLASPSKETISGETLKGIVRHSSLHRCRRLAIPALLGQ